MAAMNSFEGNVTPLFGQREVGRFVFDPSEELAERLWGLARPSYRKEMGRRGLFLYSNTGVEVTRQTDGALEPAGALLESDIGRVLSARSANSQRRLARYITGGMVRDKATNEPLGLRINMRVLLDRATADQMRKSSYIPDGRLLNEGGVEIGLSVPIQHVMPGPQLKHRYEDLERFVHGPDWHPSMEAVGRRNPSLTIGAYVTNMRMAFRKTR